MHLPVEDQLILVIFIIFVLYNEKQIFLAYYFDTLTSDDGSTANLSLRLLFHMKHLNCFNSKVYLHSDRNHLHCLLSSADLKTSANANFQLRLIEKPVMNSFCLHCGVGVYRGWNALLSSNYTNLPYIMEIGSKKVHMESSLVACWTQHQHNKLLLLDST